MPALPYSTEADVAGRLSWPAMVEALAAGHRLPRAQIGDLFLTRGDDTLMGRAAWVEGAGFGIKTFSVMAGNGARHRGGELIGGERGCKPAAPGR